MAQLARGFDAASLECSLKTAESDGRRERRRCGSSLLGAKFTALLKPLEMSSVDVGEPGMVLTLAVSANSTTERSSLRVLLHMRSSSVAELRRRAELRRIGRADDLGPRRVVPHATIDERTRGMGGLEASCGEENLLAPDDEPKYAGRDILTHELAHTLMQTEQPSNKVFSFHCRRKPVLQEASIPLVAPHAVKLSQWRQPRQIRAPVRRQAVTQAVKGIALMDI